MNFSRLCASLVAVALFAGCPKKEGPPSKEFEKARDRFFVLEASDPLGVFSRPEVKDLLVPIDAVAADSVEKGAAVELAKTIRDGISEAEKATADRAKSVEAVAKPIPLQAGSDTTPSEFPPNTPAPPPPRKDAGPPAPEADPGPTPGMSASDFATKYGVCFSKNAVYKDDKGVSGDSYILNSTYDCNQRLGSFAKELVLVAAGKVTSIVPQSAVTHSESFTLGSTTTTSPAPETPAPPPPPPVAAPAPVAAAPVLPAPTGDEITTPPVDPNANPNAVNP